MKKKFLDLALDWFLLSRVPFLSVAVTPFILGSFMAYRIAGMFHPAVFILAFLATILIQLATHYNGEVYDIREDTFSGQLERNAFSGGSQVLVQKKVDAKAVKAVSVSIALIALGIGALLQFYYKTGAWTLPLGFTAMIAGFFYSKPPFRWVTRGIGELLIAYSYGWLPVAVGFYLQTQRIDAVVHWVSIPIACTIFNVILINSFPDYPADSKAEKRNLLVRIGKQKGAVLYVVAAHLAIVVFFISLLHGVPKKGGLFYFPVFFISLFNCFVLIFKGYNDRALLEKACALTIVVNLLTSLSYILAFL